MNKRLAYRIITFCDQLPKSYVPITIRINIICLAHLARQWLWCNDTDDLSKQIGKHLCIIIPKITSGYLMPNYISQFSQIVMEYFDKQITSPDVDDLINQFGKMDI